MNSKTTLILVVALLLAVAGIWWLRPESREATKENTPGADQLLALAPDDVTAFEIKSGDETACSFTKEGDKWKMTSPIKGPAQSGTVASDVRLLTNLKYDKAYGPNDDPPGDDLTSLSKPRHVARLTDKTGKAHVLRIGNRQALSSRTYVSKEGDDKVYVVDADLNKSLNHKVEDYRGKRIIDVESNDVVSVQVTGEQSFTAAKQGAGWMIEAPEKARADLAALNKITRGICGLTVAKFIDDTPDSLRIYGLEPPRVSVTITSKVKKPSGEEATSQPTEGGTIETTVQFGSTIDDKVFAKVVGDESAGVFEVNKSVLDNVAPKLDAVRDKRIVELVPSRVQAITLTTQSGESLTLSRNGVNWMIAPPGPTIASETAELAAVNDLLNTLRDLKAVGFEEGNRPEFGLDDPRTKLELSVQGKTAPIELAVGGLTPSQTGAYVQNVSEGFIAVVPADSAAKLVVQPVSFHSRDIIDIKPNRVSQVKIRRQSQTIVLERKDGRWRMTAPIDASANDTAVKDLLAEVSSLKGRAVVAKADQRNAYGLAQPLYTLDLTVEKPAPTTMPAGENAEPPAPETVVLFATRHNRSRYAMRQNGDYIYEVEDKLISDLDKEYLDTNVLSFDSGDVRVVTLTTTDGAFRFTRKDKASDWSLDGESTFKVDKTKLDTMLKALGSLKAKRYAAYENANAEALKLDSPEMRVRVELSGGATHELDISSIGPNAADRYAELTETPGRAFVLESTDVTKFDKRAADFKK